MACCIGVALKIYFLFYLYYLSYMLIWVNTLISFKVWPDIIDSFRVSSKIRDLILFEFQLNTLFSSLELVLQFITQLVPYIWIFDKCLFIVESLYLLDLKPVFEPVRWSNQVNQHDVGLIIVRWKITREKLFLFYVFQTGP